MTGPASSWTFRRIPRSIRTARVAVSELLQGFVGCDKLDRKVGLEAFLTIRRQNSPEGRKRKKPFIFPSDRASCACRRPQSDTRSTDEANAINTVPSQRRRII